MLITFIGGGNMATALISGLLESGDEELLVHVSEPSEEARERLQSTLRVKTFSNAIEAVKGADLVVLAVKPQVIPLVLDELEGTLDSEQVILSIAAGTTIAAIEKELGTGFAIIRSMPNTPALIGEGISGAVAGRNCQKTHRDLAGRVLGAAGEVIWVPEESLMDAVTAISGSGPAYFFLLAEALAEAGTRLGLPAEISRRLADQTCIGAGAMLKHSEAAAGELRKRVTSPGGTTQAALEAFAAGGFSGLVHRAAAAARQRGEELSETGN